MSLRTLATRPGSTLVGLPLILADPAHARRLVNQATDPFARSFWSWYQDLSEGERAAALGPIMNKLWAWLLSPRLRNMLGQLEPWFDFR
ncbi:hypothetical protein ACSNOI_22230 [Actinomadura kijaniata]|uniref:hypothetical protein n=1 Tax=Actinomadura kijaniata TaxID=46161 RepID=UPI003F1A4405